MDICVIIVEEYFQKDLRWNYMNKNDEDYKRFIKIFCYPTYDMDWSGDPYSEDLIIADPSHICGIIITENVAKRSSYDTGWKTYSYNGFKPSKKDHNIIYFDKKFFQCDFVKNVLNGFFKPSKIEYEIRVLGQPDNDYWCLLFKLDNSYSIGITNLKESFLFERDGKFVFTKTEWIDDEEVIIEEYPEDWVDGKAVHEEQMSYGIYKRVVWDQSKLFTEIEDEGDSLLI